MSWAVVSNRWRGDGVWQRPKARAAHGSTHYSITELLRHVKNPTHLVLQALSVLSSIENRECVFLKNVS